MNRDREELIITMAHQILGMEYDSRDGSPVRRPLPGIDGAGGARLEVEIKGMVQNMRRQIWLDQGAWTKRIVDEIEKQAADLDLDAVIAQRVAQALQQAINNVERHVETLVKEAVRERLGDVPSLVAAAVADRMVGERFGMPVVPSTEQRCKARIGGDHGWRPIEDGDVQDGIKASALRAIVGDDGLICQACGLCAPAPMWSKR